MNEGVLAILFAFAGVIAGALAMLFYKKTLDDKTKKSAEIEAERILNRARSEAQKIDKDARQKAKDFEVRARKNAEHDIQKQKQKLKQEEQQLAERENKLEKELQIKDADLDQKARQITVREEKVAALEKRISELESEGQKRILELKDRLERTAGLSANEAKRELLAALEDEVRAEATKRALIIEEEAKAEAERKAKRIISVAISRFAGEYTPERTVTVVNLPNEDMKGKIIGREGRNIRALEAACGVDLIVDETPESVVISSFDPVRREIAKRSLEKLMEDGRVHPARIEEVIEKTKKEIFKLMKEDGEKAALELGVVGLHPEVVKTIGSLKYRQTTLQNVLQHCIEVGYLAGLMAGELGVDVNKARRAGLLHDIGKGLDHTVEGPHAVVGAEYLRKLGESDVITHAVRAHHGDEQPTSTLAFIIQAANSLSNSRPGARRQNMETYIRRMEDMESIANSFDGVLRTYAVQTGKELRVLVESSRVTDEQASMLSYDIARKIERELSYPGQILITVVRETRVVEMAR